MSTTIISYTGSDFLWNGTLPEGVTINDKSENSISIDASGQSTGVRGVITNLYWDGIGEEVSSSGLTITDSHFTGNKGVEGANGGGAVTLWSNGTAGTDGLSHAIINSEFSNNYADKGGAVTIFKQDAFDVQGSTSIQTLSLLKTPQSLAAPSTLKRKM